MTGVTGFLGGAVARGIRTAGHAVRGFARDPSRIQSAGDCDEVVTGDVTDNAAFRRAASGCDVVVHAAALVRMWARDRRQFDRVNLEGLRHAIDAARDAGARLVYTSSFLALGPTDGRVLDESAVRPAIRFHNDYERTKWIADQLARHTAESGFPLVRVYPGIVYGPGARTEGNHVVRMLVSHARGRFPGILGRGDRRLCFAYVEDVAAGFVAIVERAAPGSAYLLGGDNRTVLDLFGAFRAASGIAPPRRRVPYLVAAAVGMLQRYRAELTGIEPELTDEVVGIYRHEWAYSSARAERELGYRITSLEAGIGKTTEWLREVGELSSGRPR